MIHKELFVDQQLMGYAIYDATVKMDIYNGTTKCAETGFSANYE